AACSQGVAGCQGQNVCRTRACVKVVRAGRCRQRLQQMAAAYARGAPEMHGAATGAFDQPLESLVVLADNKVLQAWRRGGEYVKNQLLRHAFGSRSRVPDSI